MQRGKGRCKLLDGRLWKTGTPTQYTPDTFSLSPLIGKIIPNHQSQAGVEVQTEAGITGEALSGQRVNLKDEGFPMRPRLSSNP